VLARLAATVTLVVLVNTAAIAQDDEPPRTPGLTPGTAWLGVPLPARPGAAVVVGSRGPRPVMVPAGDPAVPELLGTAIRADLERAVALARSSQSSREIGTGQLWGRISGFPSGQRTAEWAADTIRRAGIKDVAVHPIAQDAKSSFWLPLLWQVTLHGDPAFGAGTSDVVLQSAIPLSPSAIARPCS
jgi:hypothetical protein